MHEIRFADITQVLDFVEEIAASKHWIVVNQCAQGSDNSLLCAILGLAEFALIRIIAMAHFVLWGTYCADALEKRTPFRDEHLARLKSLKDDGQLITLGPTEGSTHVFGIFEAEAIEVVRQLVKADVYWRENIWTSVEIYPWIQAF
tara:strand:+ start:861 stop:1298 length:438 start_codon:yes stop_codon:yes gene_type:complete